MYSPFCAIKKSYDYLGIFSLNNIDLNHNLHQLHDLQKLW